MMMAAQVKRGAEDHQVQGIKLFGATILLQQVKEEDQKSATTNNTNNDHDQQKQQEEMKRPDKIIPCPRCKSMETKFCYFNNYNVNQPRHFCKGCQRYWTAGGALRNVPVGAGRRKSKPPGRGDSLIASGYPGNCIFDGSGIHHQYPAASQFDLDRMMVGEWQLATASDGGGSGGFGEDFPAKRRRMSGSSGQTC